MLESLFPVNFAKFLRTLFLQNTSGGLLLLYQSIMLVGINNLIFSFMGAIGISKIYFFFLPFVIQILGYNAQ